MFKLISTFCSGHVLCIESCNERPPEDSKEVAEKVNDRKLRNKDAEQDAQYLVDATAASYNMISIAEIALTSSTKNELKALAGQLKKQHYLLITQLRSVAGRRAVTLPTEATEAGNEATAKLMKEKAATFDAAWLAKVEKMNNENLELYESAALHAQDSSIKSWFVESKTKLGFPGNSINAGALNGN